MTGRLRTVLRFKESACWVRGGLRDPTSCGIFWRAVMFLISGSMLKVQPTIRKRSGFWRRWGLTLQIFPSSCSRMEQNFSNSAPAEVAQKVGLRTRAETEFLRSRDCGWRPGRSGGRGLWRVGGFAHGDGRAGSSWRSGGNEFANRKLSGISQRAQRRRSCTARGGAGAAFWR